MKSFEEHLKHNFVKGLKSVKWDDVAAYTILATMVILIISLAVWAAMYKLWLFPLVIAIGIGLGLLFGLPLLVAINDWIEERLPKKDE